MPSLKRKQDIAVSGFKRDTKKTKIENGKGSHNGDLSKDEHDQLLSSVTGQILPLRGEEEEEEQEGEEGRKNGGKKKTTGKDEVSLATIDKWTAGEYLTLWATDKLNWSFKKKTQYWLLQNMYHKDKVSKAKFKIMLNYLQGLRGNQRELVQRRARDIMVQNSSDKDKVEEVKWTYKRAAKICEVLST